MVRDSMRIYNLDSLKREFGELEQVYIVLSLVDEPRTRSGLENLMGGSGRGSNLDLYIGNLIKSKTIYIPERESSYHLTDDAKKILETRLREIQMRAGVYELTKKGRGDLKYLAGEIGAKVETGRKPPGLKFLGAE